MLSKALRSLSTVCSQLIHQSSSHVISHVMSHTRAAQSAMRDMVDSQLQLIRDTGTWKNERVLVSSQGPLIRVQGRRDPVLNFCANNYLGLSSHPRVIAAAHKALDTHGAGLSSVRFICGTQDIHKQLERKIAEFHGREDAILYASCFDANAGLFEALLTADDAVISDELNHASIIDGIRLCKATRLRYSHRDMNDLERKLREAGSCRMRLIATDGVFSMDGNVAPLQSICELADYYNAVVFTDESHASGFFGRTGRGTEEFCGVDGKVDIINSTFGKALGGAAGGYTAGPRQLIDLLRNRSRPYLFSNTLPPAVVAATLQSLELISASSELIERLSVNTTTFRDRMTQAGFTLLGDSAHPICPVMLGDAKLAAQFADLMLSEGIFVIGFSYPVVPKDKARIRVQLSASHSLDDVHRAVDAFISVSHKLRLTR